MKKFLPALFFVMTAASASAQLNNEWIDFSKTYYKFKVGNTGLFRINQPVLAAAGLSGTPVANFQLWRNGKEVAIYTSVSSGTLSTNDFLEFFGEKNDGKNDRLFYRYDSLQMSDVRSLLTDTAAYFLTVNAGSNKRLVNTANNVAGNLLAPDNYFMHKLARQYDFQMNNGLGIDFGELVNSSSFDSGEGWTGFDLYGNQTSTDYNEHLFVYPAGPTASLKTVAAGNTANGRNIDISINGTSLANNYVSGYAIQRNNITGIATSAFGGDNFNLGITNQGYSEDRIVVSNYELTYPRKFDFAGKSQFAFEMPASGTGNFLKIYDFDRGAATPILYDLTNNLRITANVNGDTLQFVLPASVTARSLVLCNVSSGNIASVSSLQQRNFVNYALAANQGNYLIVSHPVLFNDGSGVNNVENYRQYRASATGGSYNAKIYDINELMDQFGWGIANNPLAIRNFSSYALANFSAAPKYIFLMGRGVDYPDYYPNQSDPNMSKLALIPTFGWPASDNLLTATRTGFTARISIGRLSAISGIEVGRYLSKVKEFELAQTSTVQTIGNKGWMKNVAQITGAISDYGLYNLLTAYMQGYESIISDTLFGGKVYNFSQNSGQYTALGTNKSIDSLFENGMSLLTYFGHSSPNTLEFNLDNPNGYHNPGKYPLILINGCATGNFFTFDTLRKTLGNGTLSEKYLFADKKGSIGFIANTHLGLPQQIDYFTTEFYKNISYQMYGQSVGDMIKKSMEYLADNYSNDFVARCHSEEITYHGDPAVRLNPQAKPDYVIEDSLISFNPSFISVADETVNINAKILNIGKATSDSITVLIQQKLPDNSVVTLQTRRMRATLYEDTLQVVLRLNPLLHKGTNSIIITIDPQNQIAELSENNNTVTKSFTVQEDEIRPLFPYNYSIVNNPAVTLYGSTASPVLGARTYTMEMDTSRLFNSASKITKTVSDSGGIIKFVPGITYTDSTVYYWRVTAGNAGPASHWLQSSFVYINGGDDGFNQSHYYQFTDNEYENMGIDSSSRKFLFDNKTRKLLVRAGIYPYYSWDQNNINLNSDQIELWGCVFSNLQFYVLDSLTHQMWDNYNVAGGNGRFGSNPVCANVLPSRKFFEFPYTDPTYRKRAMDFMDTIPAGMYVVVRNLLSTGNTTFINAWKADTATLGSGKSLWHKFKQMGFNQIDSFTSNRQFVFVFKKGPNNTATDIRQHVASTVDEHIVDTAQLAGKSVEGNLTSAWIGPMKTWNRFKWDKKSNDDSTNLKYFDIIGKDVYGQEQLVATVYNSKDTSISFINAANFPYLRVKLYNRDLQHAKPMQLKYLMLTGTKVPEGGLSANRYFVFRDTITDIDTLRFKISFKNISNVGFDSLKVKLTVKDQNGNSFSYNPADYAGSKVKPVIANDSVILSYNIPAANYGGKNELVLDVNPDNAQVEQYHFNNILFRNFWVRPSGCPGTNFYYTSGYSGGGYTYQWQVDNGSGYADLANNALYSGVGGDSLKLTAMPTNLAGNKYRCRVTQGATTNYSAEFTLKFTLKWMGTVSDAWENPGNWSCGAMPDQYTDVSVEAGAPNYPKVNTTVSCRTLKVTPGTTVRIATGANLSIKK